jgi:threonine synthase
MTFGATVISVQGSYEDTFELSKQAIDRWGWYNRNAAINPYLSEGKKTVSLEIAEQLTGRCRTIWPSPWATAAPSPAPGRASRISTPSASSTSCPG